MSDDLTSVEGRVLRAVGLGTFADITTAPLVIPEGIDPRGLLFAGRLDEAQVEAIHDRMTSRDDEDQARRAAVRAAWDATNLAQIVAAYTLGDPLPQPVYPPPEPEPAPG